MEKRKLSGKTILKLVGALLALAYLGFCLYAGITGKFPNMHRVEHVMRFGESEAEFDKRLEAYEGEE